MLLVVVFSATSHGHGVYFAVDASYSAQDIFSPKDKSGNKYIFRSKVLTGRYCGSNPEFRTAPTIRGELKRYDSVTDNPSKPKIFVIFQDPSAYPEYLIKFK